MPITGGISYNPVTPTLPESYNSGILETILRGDLDANWALYSWENPCTICDATAIDTSLIQEQHGTDEFWWEQYGDYSEEIENIDFENQDENADPHYEEGISYYRWTKNLENMNHFNDFLTNMINSQRSSGYILIVDTHLFSAEEYQQFPLDQMDNYAKYETTPVICFIINNKPCYAIRPGAIKELSATTPVLTYKGAAQIRIVDQNKIDEMMTNLTTEYVNSQGSAISNNNGDPI